MSIIGFMDEIKQDVKEMKGHLIELLKQGAVHNHLLKEHEARSVALQQLVLMHKREADNRLVPIERTVHWISILAKFLGAVAVYVASKALISHFWGA